MSRSSIAFSFSCVSKFIVTSFCHSVYNKCYFKNRYLFLYIYPISRIIFRLSVNKKWTILGGVQESGVRQRGSSDFLAGTRDIAKGKDRSEDKKDEAKPTPHQNRFLDHKRYNIPNNEEKTTLLGGFQCQQ